MDRELEQLRAELNEKIARRNYLTTRIKEEKSTWKSSRKAVQLAEQAQEILQHTAQQVQQQVHDRIASIVSRCLSAVFEEPYEFRIHFQKKRGKTEAKLVFVRDGHEMEPDDAVGGGVLDVAAFALRVACLLMRRPPLRRFLILDEPFKFVSREHHPKLIQLIEGLAEELGVQFLIVTHIEALQIGKVINLEEEM